LILYRSFGIALKNDYHEGCWLLTLWIWILEGFEKRKISLNVQIPGIDWWHKKEEIEQILMVCTDAVILSLKEVSFSQKLNQTWEQSIKPQKNR